MKLIKKNDQQTIYNTMVEGLEISFEKNADAGLILSIKKGTKKVSIMFEEEKLDLSSALGVLDDEEAKEYKFYDFVQTDSDPYEFKE